MPVHPPGTARRLKDLVVPIHEVAYFADEPDQAFRRLGFPTYWDGYFAARAAPLGAASAAVVHAAFHNFAPGEVARHVPAVWDTVSPATAHDLLRRGCADALRSVLGTLAADPTVGSAADLLVRTGLAAPGEGRVLFSGLTTMPVPQDPLERLWFGATLLREHRGDGHIAALVAAGVGGTESHVLHALSDQIPAHRYGRVHHLPAAQLDAVIDGMRARGLVADDGWLTETGAALKQQIEDATDRAAEPGFDALSPAELEQLEQWLAPIATTITTAYS